MRCVPRHLSLPAICKSKYNTNYLFVMELSLSLVHQGFSLTQSKHKQSNTTPWVIGPFRSAKVHDIRTSQDARRSVMCKESVLLIKIQCWYIWAMCICIFRGWEGIYTYVCMWRSEVNIGYLLQSLWTRVADQKVLMSSSLYFLSSGILGLNHYSSFLSPGCQGNPNSSPHIYAANTFTGLPC